MRFETTTTHGTQKMSEARTSREARSRGGHWSRWALSTALLLGVLGWQGGVAGAQTSADGSIYGHVTDNSGAALPGVQVVAHSPVVGGTFKAVSDAEGNYRVIDLPIGTDYTLDAELPGFAKFERVGLVVKAALNVSVDIALKVGSESQTVEVSGDPPLLDTESAEQAVNLSGELLRALPVTVRHDWSDSLQVTPGIISASSDAEGGQTYFSRGSENENMATLMDGMDIGSFQQNWPSNSITISNDAIGDIQIKNGANDASSPAAMGMVMNLATPTGGNQFHGSLFYLIGPQALNSGNIQGGVSASVSTYQPDFTISGPVKKDKVWFFFSGRYILRNDGISRSSIQSQQLTQLDPAFTPFANQSRGFVFLANTSIQLSGKHRLMGLVQYDSRTQDANYQWYAGNIAITQYGGGAYGARLISQWTPRLTTRFLASFNNKGYDHSASAIGGVGAQPEIDVYASDTLSGGKLLAQGSSLATLNNLNSIVLEPARKPTISGDLTYYIPKLVGTHEIDAGFYLEPHERAKETTLYANGGTIIQEDAVLNNPNNFAAGYTVFHTQGVSAASVLTAYTTANDYAWYVQDHWHPVRRLTVTAGIRPDWVSAKDQIFHVLMQHSWNWAPRVAGSYILTKNEKNVVRASWTKITDITNFSYLGTAGTSTLTTTDTYFEPTGTATFVTPGSTAVTTGKTFDPGRHQGYVREWIVGYRTQLPGDVTIDGSYIDREYRDRPAQYDTNQIYTTTTTGTVWGGLVNPAINNTYYITNNKWNWFVYQGLEVTASKQTKKLQLFTTYTYSPDHLAGTFQPYDPTAIIEPTKFANNAGIGSVRGNVTNDWTGDTRNRMWQRHQWRTGATWTGPLKIRVAGVLTGQSGTPGGPVITTTTYNGQYGPATMSIGGRTVSNPLATTYRFAYANRGIGQIFCPWLVQGNMLVAREFSFRDHQSVEGDVNILNVTNRNSGQQFSNGNNIAATSTFGVLTNIQPPRSVQFSVRYHF